MSFDPVFCHKLRIEIMSGNMYRRTKKQGLTVQVTLKNREIVTCLFITFSKAICSKCDFMLRLNNR